jgi:hypothetical protein
MEIKKQISIFSGCLISNRALNFYMITQMLLQLVSGFENFEALIIAAVQLFVVIELHNFACDGTAISAFMFVINVALIAQVVHAGFYENADLNRELTFGADFCMLLVPCRIGLYYS